MVAARAQALARSVPAVAWLAAAALAQQAGEPTVRELAACLVVEPAPRQATTPVPLVVLVAGDPVDLASARRAADALGVPLARAGFVVALPVFAADEPAAAAAARFAQLRREFRIDQGGMHLAAPAEGRAAAVRFALANAPQFQSVTLWGSGAANELAALRPLRARRLQVLAAPVVDELVLHFRTLHGARTLPGAAGDVARTLDDFHDAAANGDEARYFAILPDDAVFLGTDATERWTGAEFKAFAMPYFQRDSAWTYVPLQRHVELEADGALAWFDEVLDNDAYGECRGSGVLALRAGRWVLRQYNLTVPVPNDLMRGVATRIRAFAAGHAPAVTTVVLVRHAEKDGDGRDPGLSDAGLRRAERLAHVLHDLPIAAVYASEFARTAATVAPLCRERHLEPVAVPAADVRALAARLRREHLGGTVVVCGHSNTVPALAKALGVADVPAIDEAEFDHLLVVTIDADGAHALALRYGDG